MTVGKVHRATAVQYEQLTLVTGRQFSSQPLAAYADVGQQRRFVFGRHSERRRGTYLPTAHGRQFLDAHRSTQLHTHAREF